MIEILLVKNDFHLSSKFKDILKVVNYISKMVIHDYSIITQYKMKYIAASCIYICLKIVE